MAATTGLRGSRIAPFLAWLALLPACLWAVTALAIDFPVTSARPILAALFVAVLLVLLFRTTGNWRKWFSCLACCLAVLGWWLMLAPSNNRNWQADVDHLARVEIDGDLMTVHNLRNFDYRSEVDFVPRWEIRTYDLAQLSGVDIFVTYWGSPWIAHPIMSFRFGENDYLAISVETRKEVGEEYSALRGFFRQYELIYIMADERDVIRLRSNYRTGEEVYLFHTVANVTTARAILMSYVATVNELVEKPVFYNAITSNCTTGIRLHTIGLDGVAPAPWDWRLLLNGKADEFAYQHGRLSGDMPFPQLKAQAHINDAARLADQSPNFSWLIRQNRAGFARN